MRSARALISALVLAASAATSSPLLAEGDPAQGEVLYRPCRACHMIGDGAVHRVGPHLNGIIDRVIGAVPGYDFSDDLVNAGADGRVWDADALDRFMAGPRDYFPRTRMVFRGVRDEQDRLDLIAYMLAEGGRSDSAVMDAANIAIDPEVATILAIAGDVPYGEYLSSECTACHRDSGGSDIPTIRGLAPASFIAGMVDYRNGTREHQVMNTVARRLGDEELAALAAYFARTE